MLRVIIRVERLKLRFNFGERGRVQQLAEIDAAKNFLELRLIDGQGLRSPLSERSVAVVDVIRDVVEQQRGRIWRRFNRIHRRDADSTALDSPEYLRRGRQIEDVAQTLPERLHEDGE